MPSREKKPQIQELQLLEGLLIDEKKEQINFFKEQAKRNKELARIQEGKPYWDEVDRHAKILNEGVKGYNNWLVNMLAMLAYDIALGEAMAKNPKQAIAKAANLLLGGAIILTAGSALVTGAVITTLLFKLSPTAAKLLERATEFGYEASGMKTLFEGSSPALILEYCVEVANEPDNNGEFKVKTTALRNGSPLTPDQKILFDAALLIWFQKQEFTFNKENQTLIASGSADIVDLQNILNDPNEGIAAFLEKNFIKIKAKDIGINKVAQQDLMVNSIVPSAAVR